jgi:hypothetical protein
LLVFDNVEHPSHIRDFLPKARRGHIIITSRYAAWQEVAQRVSLALWSPGEAISYLSKRTGQPDETAAAAIAEALGYLPLALVQAAAYIEETGCSFTHYLELLQAHPAETFRLRPTASDAEKVIATIWEIAFQQVAEKSPRAVELLNLFAFLPPDRIPRRLLTGQANRLPVSLAETVQDSFVLDAAITVLRSYSLIDTTEDVFSVHRLVQLVVRERLDSESYRLFSEAARDLQDSPSSRPEMDLQDSPSSRPEWEIVLKQIRFLGIVTICVGALLSLLIGLGVLAVLGVLSGTTQFETSTFEILLGVMIFFSLGSFGLILLRRGVRTFRRYRSFSTDILHPAPGILHPVPGERNVLWKIYSDFSVVLFRSKFMLVSENNRMKVHTNQWVLTIP